MVQYVGQRVFAAAKALAGLFGEVQWWLFAEVVFFPFINLTYPSRSLQSSLPLEGLCHSVMFSGFVSL